MQERRQFPVVIASLVIGLIVLLGLLELRAVDPAGAPADSEGAAARDKVPPGDRPALPGLPADPAATTTSATEPPTPDASGTPPPEPPEPRVRVVRQGPTPKHAAVTGWVDTAVAARDGRVQAVFRDLKATIWRVNGREKEVVEDATGLPSETGEFAIRDLEDGEYLIEFVSEDRGRVVRAKREFRIAGYTADLGDVDLVMSAGVRAKVVDVDGRPIEQADVVVVRPEEEPEQARRIRADDEGFVTYFDLEPDLVHQVVVLGLPTRLERSVRTPQSTKEMVTVVFETPLRTVPTIVAFFIDGETRKVQEIVGLQSDTRLKSLPNEEGILTTRLLPGTYRFWTEDREGTLVVNDDECVRAKVHLYPKPAEEDR